MAEFKPAFDETIGKEGGYSNHKSDRGGRTWQGIAESFWGKKYPRIFQILDVADEMFKSDTSKKDEWLRSNHELSDLVESFYVTEFWDKTHLGDIPWQSIANRCFDIAVNCGVQRAGLVVQVALNIGNRNSKDYPDLVEDGFIGPRTISCIEVLASARGVKAVEQLLQHEHYHVYRDIVRKNPEQEVFFWGWFLNRVL